jgi:hypothetical protein
MFIVQGHNLPGRTDGNARCDGRQEKSPARNHNDLELEAHNLNR